MPPIVKERLLEKFLLAFSSFAPIGTVCRPERKKQTHALTRYFTVIYCSHMNQATFATTKTVTLQADKVRQLFALSSSLADYTEDILESQGDYADEFISGLNQSLKEAEEGKLRQINSLRDLP